MKALSTLEDYYEKYGDRVLHDSERLFVDEFLHPLLGDNLSAVIPQYPFVDRTGSRRQIDFAFVHGSQKIALEVNGESYHAEGILPFEQFDANLFRQNEIIRRGFQVLRFSYSQLQSPKWRPIVQDSLRDLFYDYAPELLSTTAIEPNEIQLEALHALNFHRNQGYDKGVVILPTGTGKTILSALDSSKSAGKTLFVVHRLEILKQAMDAYKLALGGVSMGILTGDEKDNIFECDYLFASKDSLNKAETLQQFAVDHFDYIVVDEVHHGETPSYRAIFEWFKPKFMLGMTATPDRTDRKDILELFDYHKVYEITLPEVIDRGLLVPFSYHGLTDNVDYTKIRYENNKYRLDDLERTLIVPGRNKAILEEYLSKGGGNKAIGFCVSIKHADRMAQFFNEHGVSAVAIHSATPDQGEKMKAFRNNDYNVAFTVDLFNEGVDFPNVRTLLFLRPTESKTVFVQQLGRGLRLCSGKDEVVILDFIGNYKKANLVRQYLSKGSKPGSGNGHGEKAEYIYPDKCKVEFTDEVEQILNRQDAESQVATKEDLVQAYHEVKERVERKPSRSDIDQLGRFKVSHYTKLFGSWISFLKEIGEDTQASFHYPQGTTLGHTMAILWFFSGDRRAGSQFDDAFIRMSSGGFSQGRLGTYQRQVGYKLAAAMELGLLMDVRLPGTKEMPITLTPDGQMLASFLEPYLSEADVTFEVDDEGVYSSRMRLSDEESINIFRKMCADNADAKALVLRIFLGMSAVQQMLAYVFHVARASTITKKSIYENFFESPMVRQFHDRQGIEPATEEASKRRCPFLLNILAALDVLDMQTSSVVVKKLLLMPELVRANRSETLDELRSRLINIEAAWPNSEDALPPLDLSIARELFGKNFLTGSYHLQDIETFGTN